MPERITISQAARHAGGPHKDEAVEIAGWLYNLRKSGKIVFPIVRDGTGLLQCVAMKNTLPEEVFESLKHLTQESSLILRGKLRAEARAQFRRASSRAGQPGADHSDQGGLRMERHCSVPGRQES